MSTVLSTDKSLRKSQPMARGLLDYFPRALAAVSNVSFVANEQHNPGEEMHWAKEKSTDHADCIIRHMVDRGRVDDDGLRHSAKLAWRALALLETELEAGVDSAVVAYATKAEQIYGVNLLEPFTDEDTLLGPNEELQDASEKHTFTGHMMAGNDYLPAEPESTGHLGLSTKPFDLPVLRPDQTVNERGEIVPFATQLPASDFDADACGTTDGTTPIEFRVNTTKDIDRECWGCRNHWIIRNGNVLFCYYEDSSELPTARSLASIQDGLESGHFTLCNDKGRAL